MKGKNTKKKSNFGEGNGGKDRRNNEQIKKKHSLMWRGLAAAFLAVTLIGLATVGVKFAGRQPEDGAALTEGQGGTEDTGISGGADGSAGEIEEPAYEEEAAVEEETEPEEGLPEDLKALMEMGVPLPEKEVDFEDLQENVNRDIYAWIYIPDTKIDYPVLQHPVDNQYYLNYNLDDSYGYPGCIYTERYNRKDFSDPLTVLYGHNMKNGTMFAGLHNYEDSVYFQEHPYVYIYTPDRLYVYRIFISHEYGNEHLLYNRDYTAKEEMERFLGKIAEVRGMNCNRAEDAKVSSDSHILVLSTCMADKPDRRYLVQGVLLNEE